MLAASGKMGSPIMKGMRTVWSCQKINGMTKDVLQKTSGSARSPQLPALVTEGPWLPALVTEGLRFP